LNTIYFDSPTDDLTRRQMLYAGDILVYSPRASALSLCELARQMTADAFAPHDPRTAQHHFPVEAFATILGKLKPAFIHHPDAKAIIQRVLIEAGCDPSVTYFDVPRLRTSTSHDYLTTGIAYAFHPHRDTWYSAPQNQINWWIPVYDITADNCLAFHPKYWQTPLKNSSHTYNYDEWNRTSRFNAQQHIKTDTRVQPKPEEPVELEPQLRVVAPAGSLILFSGAQLHSSVPNTSGVTRYSIDFRTVNLDDIKAMRGAPNVDSTCSGTTMRDYLQAGDLSHVPEEWVKRYDVVKGR